MEESPDQARNEYDKSVHDVTVTLLETQQPAVKEKALIGREREGGRGREREREGERERERERGREG